MGIQDMMNNGTLPSMRDIHELGMHDTAVNQVWSYSRENKISEKDMLMMMVLVLAEQKKQYFDEIVRLNANSTTPLFKG